MEAFKGVQVNISYRIFEDATSSLVIHEGNRSYVAMASTDDHFQLQEVGRPVKMSSLRHLLGHSVRLQLAL